MKKVSFFIIVIFLTSCSKKYGYICDEDLGNPIEGVKVQDIDNVSNIDITKSNGEFSFKECGDLIISHKGYITDTLKKHGCKPEGKCFNGHIFYMKKLK